MSTCKNCGTEDHSGNLNCEKCNYPIGGTKEQQATFIAKQIIQKSDVQTAIARLKHSRIVLFVIGAYCVIVSFLPGIGTENSYVIYFNIGLGVMFLFFGVLSFKFPKISILLPLVIICIYYIFLLTFNFPAFYQGIIWKFLIVFLLVYGFFGVMKANKILKQNKYLAGTLGYTRL